MYQLLARLIGLSDWRFMNYGYTAIRPDQDDLALDPADEIDRYSIQLYRHVAASVDLSKRTVLEVGSGRGGGSYYLQRYHDPSEVVGVDFSEHAIALCNRIYSLPGLRFVHGDAEDLPFDAESFDAVVNVESSHCYGSMPRFLAEVRRVLRPGGHLLFADFRRGRQVEELHALFGAAGLESIASRDITQNVLSAIHADAERRSERIRRSAPVWFVGLMEEFAGFPGSGIYEDLVCGRATYVSHVLRKAAF